MDVECPRCENEFEIEGFIFGDDAKCQKCGLFIETEGDGYLADEDGEIYYEVSNDTPADRCKACENLNLESCVGICKVDELISLAMQVQSNE